MAQLVLTLVGDDRAGLVRSLADAVAAHGGNWERSELAELAGAFAGIVLVSVPDEALSALTDELHSLRGLLHITPYTSTSAGTPVGEKLSFTVLGNDQPGIVREITRTLGDHGLSIDRFTSRTLDAPMSGGTLFEATVSAHMPSTSDAAAATEALERIAGEIQVDVTID